MVNSEHMVKAMHRMQAVIEKQHRHITSTEESVYVVVEEVNGSVYVVVEEVNGSVKKM